MQHEYEFKGKSRVRQKGAFQLLPSSPREWTAFQMILSAFSKNNEICSSQGEMTEQLMEGKPEVRSGHQPSWTPFSFLIWHVWLTTMTKDTAERWKGTGLPTWALPFLQNHPSALRCSCQEVLLFPWSTFCNSLCGINYTQDKCSFELNTSKETGVWVSW